MDQQPEQAPRPTPDGEIEVARLFLNADRVLQFFSDEDQTVLLAECPDARYRITVDRLG